MAGKRKFTDEEVKFIFSFQNRITPPEIATECDKKWPERGISEANVKSVKSYYLIGAQGNVQTQRLHQRSMREEHDQNCERIASMIQAKYEDEAEMQELMKAKMEKRQKVRRETEKRDFESFQSSEKVRATLGLPKRPSNANHRPKAATSAMINEARKQGQVDSARSEGTPELNPVQVSQSPTLHTSQTSAVRSTSSIQVSTEGARMSKSKLSQNTALSSTKSKPSLGSLKPESNISLTTMASNQATNSDDTEYSTFYE